MKLMKLSHSPVNRFYQDYLNILKSIKPDSAEYHQLTKQNKNIYDGYINQRGTQGTKVDNNKLLTSRVHPKIFEASARDAIRLEGTEVETEEQTRILAAGFFDDSAYETDEVYEPTRNFLKHQDIKTLEGITVAFLRYDQDDLTEFLETIFKKTGHETLYLDVVPNEGYYISSQRDIYDAPFKIERLSNDVFELFLYDSHVDYWIPITENNLVNNPDLLNAIASSENEFLKLFLSDFLNSVSADFYLMALKVKSYKKYIRLENELAYVLRQSREGQYEKPIESFVNHLVISLLSTQPIPSTSTPLGKLAENIIHYTSMWRILAEDHWTNESEIAQRHLNGFIQFITTSEITSFLTNILKFSSHFNSALELDLNSILTLLNNEIDDKIPYFPTVKAIMADLNKLALKYKDQATIVDHVAIADALDDIYVKHQTGFSVSNLIPDDIEEV